MAKKIKLEAGVRIAYSVAFLKSIDATTGDLPQRRGKFVAFVSVGSRTLCRVDWDDVEGTNVVNRDAIAPVGPNTEFCDS